MSETSVSLQTEKPQESPSPSQTTERTGTETTLLNQQEKPSNETEKTLLNQEVKEGDKGEKKEEVKGPPEKYADFKTPEGYELDKGVVEEAGPLFKKMGLSQDQAQELVSFYSKHAIASHQEAVNLWKTTRDEWITEVKADPEIGGKLDIVKATVSKAIDSVVGKEHGDAFRQAMDYTGAGNNLPFIRALYKMAQQLTEGTHVSGKGPASAAGAGQRPATLADALYTNNPPVRPTAG